MTSKAQEAKKKSSHGMRSRYQAGCRCGDCTLANSRYMAGWKDSQRLVPTEPWRPIVAAIAWQMDMEPDRLIKSVGLNGATAAGILTGRYTHITPYTDSRLRLLLALLPKEESL